MASEEELQSRIAQLERALSRARADAVTDELTGLLNRRGWMRAVRREQARSTRHGIDAMVAVVDLNDFKSINDERGHHVGDELLRRCAKVLIAATRTCDFIARVGGDEFAVLAVQATAEESWDLDQRIVDALAEAGVDATAACVPLSSCDSLEQAWRLADQAMLERKTA